jgi:hypothetical protein
VVVGDNVNLQNYALVYEPAQLEDGVFIGPAVVLPNDTCPFFPLTHLASSRGLLTGQRKE